MWIKESEKYSRQKLCASFRRNGRLIFRVSPGGLILLDEIFRWMGTRKAVDGYIAQNGIRIFWSRIDDHSLIGVKQN